MKIWTKIAKLQLYENLNKNVNENMVSFTFLYKFSWGFMKGNLSNNKKCHSHVTNAPKGIGQA